MCGSFVGSWQSQGGLTWEIREHHAKESFLTLVRIPCLPEDHVIPWKGSPGGPRAKANKFPNDARSTKDMIFSCENILFLQTSNVYKLFGSFP